MPMLRTDSLVISLTLMAYMHKMFKSYNDDIYIYTCFMNQKCVLKLCLQSTA